MSLYDDISILSVDEIRSIVINKLSITRASLRSKAGLIGHIDSLASDDLKAILRSKAVDKRLTAESKAGERKQKRIDQQHNRRVSRRIEDDNDVPTVSNGAKFLSVANNEEVKICYREFFEATGSSAVATVVCAVCANEVDIRDTGFKSFEFRDIPNGHRLIPRHPHPAHDLYDNMLLEPRGITRSGQKAKICNKCLDDLKDNSPDPPKLSLANNLWIGRVPWELLALTFAEQQLIGQLFNKVHVFKLWPSSSDFNLEGETLQRGLRGNVCTFELDHKAIASMVSGRKMPRPPEILLSIIAVTIIRHGKLSKHLLRNLFRVRRRTIYLALVWLKANNRHWADIEIDPDRLASLPDDDVPDHILKIIRQSQVIGIIDEEGSGYAHHDNVDVVGKSNSWTIIGYGSNYAYAA